HSVSMHSMPVAFSTRCLACTLIFFFQAEDGIRDDLVTGVQTCALPISERLPGDAVDALHTRVGQVHGEDRRRCPDHRLQAELREIGRASCRERVKISGDGVTMKKKK